MKPNAIHWSPADGNPVMLHGVTGRTLISISENQELDLYPMGNYILEIERDNVIIVTEIFAEWGDVIQSLIERNYILPLGGGQ